MCFVVVRRKTWEINLQEQIGPTHVKLSSYYHGSIGVVLFIKRELIWFCSSNIQKLITL